MRKEIRKHKGYFVSDDGKVYKEDLELIQHTNAAGHKYVWLGDKIHTVCYLVASAFIPNDNHCFLVGYKDGNKSNLKADNLYWYYSGEIEGDGNTTPLYKSDLNGNIIAEYSTTKEAAKANKISYWKIQPKTQDADIAINGDMVFIQSIYYNRYTIKDKIAKELKKQKKIKTIIKIGNKEKVISHQCATFQINQNGDIIREFSTTKEAADTNNIPFNNMSQQFNKKKYYNSLNGDIILIREKDYTPSLLKLIKFKLNKKEKAKEIKRPSKYNLKKKLFQIDKDGEILNVFEGMRNLCNELNIPFNKLNNNLHKKNYCTYNDIIIVREKDWEDEEKRDKIMKRINR